MEPSQIDLNRSHVFRLADLPAHHNANGSESWQVMHGRLPTGEAVAVHESIQPAGIPPNPAHRIEHTEFICMREGTLEVHLDGKTDIAKAGDVIFVSKGTLHGVRNIGAGPAAYIIVAVGGDINQ